MKGWVLWARLDRDGSEGQAAVGSLSRGQDHAAAGRLSRGHFSVQHGINLLLLFHTAHRVFRGDRLILGRRDLDRCPLNISIHAIVRLSGHKGRRALPPTCQIVHHRLPSTDLVGAVILVGNKGLRGLEPDRLPWLAGLTGHRRPVGLTGLARHSGAGPGSVAGLATRGPGDHAGKRFWVEGQFFGNAVFFYFDGGGGEVSSTVHAQDAEASSIFPGAALGEDGEAFLGLGIDEVNGRAAGTSGVSCEDEVGEAISGEFRDGFGELKLERTFAAQFLVAVDGVFRGSK